MTPADQQPSFYYLLIAQSCFGRSRRTNDRARSDALCAIGRDYLSKARGRVVAVSHFRDTAPLPAKRA
jgi:hypothetical protein